jgi:hypothetical protein
MPGLTEALPRRCGVRDLADVGLTLVAPIPLPIAKIFSI